MPKEKAEICNIAASRALRSSSTLDDGYMPCIYWDEVEKGNYISAWIMARRDGVLASLWKEHFTCQAGIPDNTNIVIGHGDQLTLSSQYVPATQGST